jgi:alkylhydroperoxidase/carboxymuconolactone decarboxylase family protein YurZ
MSTNHLVEIFGQEPWVENLAASFPKAAEGLALTGDVIHTDGALSRSEKALCVAAIAAVKRLPDVVTTYLGSAFDGGLTVDEARGAAINVLISRGIPGYRVFSEALADLSEEAPSPVQPFTQTLTTEEILEYFRGVFGDVPPNVSLGAQHVPVAIHGYLLMRQAALEESPLEPRLADLMLCAVNAAEFRDDFVEIHARFALRGGATPAQLTEAVACTMPFAGVAAWLSGATGVIAAMETD